MSAGTKLGNTDRLTDAYIKGLVERGHSVTKVYLGSMRIEGCRGCGVCQRLAHQCAVRDGMQDIYPLLQNVTQWSWLHLCISGESRHS